jgi:aldehyde:ferredoxin oxidoreductase
MKPVRDDVLPERLHTDQLTQGLNKGAYYPPETFYKQRALWYEKRGCDERGIPTENHLRELELGFVIPVLRSLGLLTPER